MTYSLLVRTVYCVTQVNLLGPIAVCKEFLPLLKKSPASRIINISSSCAETRLPMASVYGASKVNRSFRESSC